MSTYVKMYRSLLDHDLLGNDNTAYIVFTKILLKADWKTGTYRTGRKKLGLLTNLKDTTAWAALQRLANDGALTLRTTGRYTDITICNWWKYQGQSEKVADRSVTHDEQPNDTKQEHKKKKQYISANEQKALDILNKVVNRDFSVVPATAKRTLSKFSLEQIETALFLLIKDDWHRPKLATLPASYLLRVDTIDKFLSKKVDKSTTRSLPDIQKTANMSRREILELEELEQG